MRPLNDEDKLKKMVNEIITELGNAISDSADNSMQEAWNEAMEFIIEKGKESPVSGLELHDLLKAHGLSGSQLELKSSIYAKTKNQRLNGVFSEIWFDFVNSLLGSIPNQVIPGIGAIKEIKDMLHIKHKHKI